jgi:D-glycero-D-manno-heptose 1,7-bisphosphate phosphatase
MSLADLTGIHQQLRHKLAAAGAEVDAIYSCPHDEGSCDCRKPGPGLFLQAVDDDPLIDLGGSAMVGDSLSDIQAGGRLGMVTVLLKDPPQAPDGGVVRPDHVARALEDAVEWLLAHAPKTRGVSARKP